MFANGIRVFDDYLLDLQRERYAAVNLHEPEEESWIVRLCDVVPPGSFRFWDVGAGIGYYALLVATRRPDAVVAAFEPLPEHALAIETHRTLNGLAAERIAVRRMAVAAAPGLGRLSAATFGSALIEADADSGLAVSITSLDAEFAACAERLDLVKVDVQGGEAAVLEGARHAAERIDAWVVGTHGDDVHGRCHALLVEMGYAIAFSQTFVAGQPDGLIVAVRGNERLDAMR